MQAKSRSSLGAGPNIGSGIALALARYGVKVAVNDVSKESIDAAIARIERTGGEAMTAPGDVTDEDVVRGYARRTSPTSQPPQPTSPARCPYRAR